MHRNAPRNGISFALAAIAVTGAALAALTLSTSIPATQSFDGIGTSATATLPADFRVDRPSTVRTVGTFAAALSATTQVGGANLSSSAANGIYNFGSGTTTTGPDRAIGFLSSGTATQSGNLYVQLTNTTGASLSGLQIAYAVEKYRGGSNAAGFRIQLFYSVDGTAWTSAGSAFLTSFAADAANAGFATAPGATVNVSAPLNIAIPNGGQFYLAWNYSVASGTMTTNGQALAIDDISIAGIGEDGDAAPAVQTTTPTNGAVNVPVTSNIAVNFSESVEAAASSFSLECPSGSPQAFSLSASPGSSFTLDPTSALPYSTVCTAKVIANQIVDTDTTDPPDTMASDFTFSFTTADPPTDAAPAVATTMPANGSANVAVDADIVVNFTESVNAGASAFSIQCPSGSPLIFTETASPARTFTLHPTAPLPFNTSCTVTVAAAQISDTDADDPPDQMATDFTFSFKTSPAGAGKVVINEIDADTPGNPDQAEFVELYDGGVGHTPLDGLVVVFYDGGLSPFTGKQSYVSFDLDGYSTDANGYFVLGNPGVASAGLIFDPGAFGLLQNGPDAVALYAGDAADFPVGTNVTTANLLDAIVYGTDDPSPSNLLPLITSGQLIVNEDANGAATLDSSQRCPNGMGGVRTSNAYRQATPTPGAANNCPSQLPPSDVVISQIYGGGGNAGATYHNDYVELFNRGTVSVDLTGWSIQYASASGSGWSTNLQPLGGTIGPGEYYLIALASGGANGSPLPAANINGQINMSGTSGKVALSDTFDPLTGNCPLASVHVRDFIGYGSADCGEGATTAPTLSNSTAGFRQGNGAVDTNVNHSDIVVGAPNPRQTAAIVEIGPFVLLTDPAANAINAPRDATILVTFTEPVDVVDSWFDINCAVTGHHNDATFATNGRDHYITPNVNFEPGEQCTVTIFKDQIHDQDLDDAGPNTDTLLANYVWSFTVANGTPPPFPSSIHLALGNPTAADLGEPNNYLMDKPEFALSYNRDLGRPNWVSWHLSNEWTGTLERVDTFRPDPQVPPDWYRVQSFDFSGSGFDRGHMTPNADRDKETSIPINQATFLMSNMVAQAPDNNQGPWAAFEAYLRSLTDDGSQEIFIVAGPAGAGGVGSNIPATTTTTVANGHVTVPAWTWKVALVLPKDASDPISRVSCSTRSIAVIMPNVQGIRNDPWQNYLTTVDAVEALTGYDLYSNLPPSVQYCVEAGTNGANPPPDTTAPIVSCAAPDGAWHADNVALACTASDGASGLANPTEASFSLVTNVSQGTEDGNASTGTRTICDVAGNCTIAGPVAGNKIDRKAPSIVVTTPSNGAVYQMNDVVNAAYSCPETGSGLASCLGTVVNGHPIDTSSPGAKTFVIDATDAAGNTASVTVNYEVKRTLTAIGPATVWIGLKNSDDTGLRLDLRGQVLVNGAVVASGVLNNASGGSSGFNNAILQIIALSLAGSVDVPAGAQLSVEIGARRTCASNGRNSGTVREWFDGLATDSGSGRDAGSRVRITLGGTTSDYFLRSGFGLSTTAGSSRQFVDAIVSGQVACPARPFTSLGIWSVTLP